MCRSKKLKTQNSKLKAAFSLIEVMTALGILALISSSVCVVINRCMASAADSAQRYQAFEVARDNMETLLSKDSVKEMVEYGQSDKYPQIQWQTTVETFYEPITERMWIQAICSAEYTDTAGEVQTVELTHWLTDLTKEQLLQIIEEQEKEKEWLDELGEDELDEDELSEDEPSEDEPGEDMLDEDKPAEQEMDDDVKEFDDGVKRIGERTFEELVEEGFPRELLEALFRDK